MNLSTQQLRGIAARASTLWERLGDGVILDHVPDEVARARLESWCQVIAGGEREQFERRLTLDNLDIATASAALERVIPCDDVPLPRWTEILQKAMLHTFASDDASVGQDPSLPFAEILLPFVSIARQELIERAGVTYAGLAAPAHAALEQQLLRDLLELAASTLERELSLWQTSRHTGLARLLHGPATELEPDTRRAFSRALLAGNLVAFFEEYSVLARLVATRTDLWIESSCELLQRLASDAHQLREVFPGAIGQVVAVEPGLSDPHSGARQVCLLHWASGRQLIYKPRSLQLEQTFYDVLLWLNEHGTQLPLKVVRLLDRSTHGWAEFVEAEPCLDADAVIRYYRRSGMLMCIVYLLHGMDCYAENLIACGEDPVLVDAEMLLHPRTADNEEFQNSVLHTGLLPRWELDLEEQGYTVAGLADFAHDETPAPSGYALDEERLGKVVPRKFPTNMPVLHDVPRPVSHYRDAVEDGFRQMYDLLQQHRKELLGPDSPLVALAFQQVRFCLRPTSTYDALLRGLRRPQFMRDGADRSIQIDVLSRGLLASQNRLRYWPLLRTEALALEQCDIPLFHACSDTTDLVEGGRTIHDCFQGSGYARMRQLLSGLDRHDLELQVGCIRAALDTRSGQRITSVPIPGVQLANVGSDELDSATTWFVKHALAIGEQIQDRAVALPDGGVTWLGMGYDAWNRRRLQPVGMSLYDGHCGIALFLAALARCTDQEEFGDLALAALQPLRFALTNGSRADNMPGEPSLGGATGLGGSIYTLVRVAQFLDHPTLLDDARRLATQITPARIRADRSLGVLDGSAGAILGLLGLYGTTRDPSLLRQACVCGEHLLACRTPSKDGTLSWAAETGKLLAGFSHGAAGIAYSLLRLYAATGMRSWLNAAVEGLAYEHSVYSSEVGNWPDLRGDNPVFSTGWCHGIAGGGLARLGILSIYRTAEIESDIAVALRTSEALELQEVDQLCCGTAGNVEALLVAAQMQLCPSWEFAAGRRMEALLCRATDGGQYRLFPEIPGDVYHPGFFQGTAGIGYQLLRLSRPSDLPSVLLWE